MNALFEFIVGLISILIVIGVGVVMIAMLILCLPFIIIWTPIALVISLFKKDDKNG